MAVVAQLCGVDDAGPLGVDDGCALEGPRPMARLEFQQSLVVAPGAVGQGHDGLPTALEALAARHQSHALDEVPIGVVVHRRGVPAKSANHTVTPMRRSDRDAKMDETNVLQNQNRIIKRPLLAEWNRRINPSSLRLKVLCKFICNIRFWEC